MSCSVECIVAIYSISKLVSVIQAMALLAADNGAGLEEKIEMKQEAEIVDELGKRVAVDMVLVNAYGDRIGVKAPKIGEEKPLEFVFSNSKSPTVQATMDKIKQAYARLQVIDQLKQKGYQQVKEERLPNGAIRLVVERWR
jgi:hypothetical protein